MELLVWCVVEDWISRYVRQIPEKYARVNEVTAIYPDGSFADYTGCYGEEPVRVLAVCAHAVSRQDAELVLNSMEVM
jgi:hypothetical protein